MIAWIDRSFRRFLVWLRGSTPLPAATAAPIRNPVAADVTKQEDGRFYHLGDVLDRLDSYFDSLRVLKRFDHDGYELFSKVGGVVLPTSYEVPWTFADLRGIGGIPAFGMVSIFGGDVESPVEEDWMLPRIIMFRKMTGWAHIEKTNLVTMEMLLIFMTRKNKTPTPARIYCGVSADGQFRVLKQQRMVPQKIKRRGKRAETVLHRRMTYDPFWVKYAAEKGENIHAFVGRLFCMAAYSATRAESGLQVLINKGDLRCRIAVDMLRTPDFFKDRDLVVNDRGTKKRVFHYVRPHTRLGRIIKAHFRGLRNFRWSGYEVTVGVPGKHHAPLIDLDMSAFSPEVAPDGLTAGEVGDLIAKDMAA